jgi:hypothetical protein
VSGLRILSLLALCCACAIAWRAVLRGDLITWALVLGMLPAAVAIGGDR